MAEPGTLYNGDPSSLEKEPVPHLLPGLEKTWQSRSASCGHFALPHTSPASGQPDLMTVVSGHGLKDRDISWAGWSLQQEEGCGPPNCLLAPPLSLSQGLQEAAEI